MSQSVLTPSYPPGFLKKIVYRNINPHNNCNLIYEHTYNNSIYALISGCYTDIKKHISNGHMYEPADLLHVEDIRSFKLLYRNMFIPNSYIIIFLLHFIKEDRYDHVKYILKKLPKTYDDRHIDVYKKCARKSMATSPEIFELVYEYLTGIGYRYPNFEIPTNLKEYIRLNKMKPWY